METTDIDISAIKSFEDLLPEMCPDIVVLPILGKADFQIFIA
jgi:hypothetical protein